MVSWDNLPFQRIGELRPHMKGGAILEEYPHRRFKNPDKRALHDYGAGPFCRFSIPAQPPSPGVWALTLSEQLVYVGEALDLTRRINNDCGQISPSACYQGGQPTHCRINTLILEAARRGESVQLWFLPTTEQKEIRRKLVARRAPIWNKRG